MEPRVRKVPDKVMQPLRDVALGQRSGGLISCLRNLRVADLPTAVHVYILISGVRTPEINQYEHCLFGIA